MKTGCPPLWLCALVFALQAQPLQAQTQDTAGAAPPPASGATFNDSSDLQERLLELERKLAELESADNAALGLRVEELEKQVADLEVEQKKTPADGFLTMAGEHFRLSGKAEILYVKTEGFRDPIVGDTDEREGRLLVDVLRLTPRIRLNKHFQLRGQIDFKPTGGDTVLKEAFLRFRAKPKWWFRPEVKLGLEDRFIRMDRDTKNYPLAGTAFWRDETVGLFTVLRLGDKDGPPKPKKKGKGGEPDAAEESPKKPRHPFDFGRNAGEVQLHLSIANIQRLDLKEVGFDDAEFNEILQDDRNIFDDLNVREIGLGFGYARNFEQLGELSALAFYYLSDLNSDSVDVLQEDLTLRDALGNVIAGYGDSQDDDSYRFGFGGEYFLPAKILLGKITKTRKKDGLRVKAQWIKGEDGEMRRESWFAQTGYRYSFRRPLLLNRYFQSIEPIVRYGEFKSSINADPALPGTWDRDALLVGLIAQITKNMIFKVEYTFHDEETGGGGGTPGPSSVDNNEFAADLVVRF